MTPAADLYQRLIQPLHGAGIPYMVTGGLAAIIYGEPRLTNDVDIVVALAPGDAEVLTGAYSPSEYYVPPVEVVREEAGRAAQGHFNVLDLETALRADFYCSGDDPLAGWAMARTREVTVAGHPIRVAPIEYVILLKLRYYRHSGSDRHLRDIAAMLRISGELIDRLALSEWIERLGLAAEWGLATRDTVNGG